jgi:hypothetical protein
MTRVSEARLRVLPGIVFLGPRLRLLLFVACRGIDDITYNTDEDRIAESRTEMSSYFSQGE